MKNEAADRMARIKILAESGLNARKIAHRMKLHPGVVRRYLARIADNKPPVDPIEVEQARVAERAERDSHRDAVKELAFRNWLSGIISENINPMPMVISPPRLKPSGKAHERHALLVMSDWHFEEIVRAEGVMGINSYDIPTACRRVHRVVHSAMEWKRDREAAGRCRVVSLTVALLGDMITGTLHGLERHSDAPNVIRSALACGDLIAMALRDLSSAFASVKVVCVSGNHGRLPDDRKVPTKDPTRSFDYLAYQVAKRRLENQKNMEWDIPDSYGVMFDVGGHPVYGVHGNFINNPLGVVGYGVQKFAGTLAGNLGASGNRLRYVVTGHWHRASSAEFAGVEVIINPSLIGTQEYGFLNSGSVNRPAQTLLILDRDLGLTELVRLYGEGPGYTGSYEVSV